MALEAALQALGGGDMRIPPDVQASRDRIASNIRQDEVSPNTNLIDVTPDMERQVSDRLSPLSGALSVLRGETVSQPPKAAPAAPIQAAAPVSGPPTMGQRIRSAAGTAMGMTPMGSGLAALGEDAEGVKGIASGIAATVAGGIVGAYKAAAPSWLGGTTFDEAVKAIEDTRTALTHVPTTEAGKNAVNVMGSKWNPLNWPAMAGEKIAESGLDAGVLTPAEAAAVKAGSTMITPGMIWKGGKALLSSAKPVVAPFASGGAAATSTAESAKAAVAGASPELQQAVAKIKPADLNPEALALVAKGESLPVPMKLTAGQVIAETKKNGALLSWEQNNRATQPQIHQLLSEQSPALHENLRVIRDEVAPDIFSVKPVENAETIIKGYQTQDAIVRADISAKYKALQDANGGKFPMDGPAFIQLVDDALSKELKARYVPKEIKADIKGIRKGGQMTFEQFENMKTNLAAEIRKAQRAEDGNTVRAASIVYQALESMPLSPEAAALKPLADAARGAAKARFDLLKKDPAYKAAVNDIAPEKFAPKYVIGAPARDVETMVKHLGEGTPEHQAAAAIALNHLREHAGTEANNFSQAGYNKALRGLETKLPVLVGQKATRQLADVGEYAHATTFQPRGGWVNNSNTSLAIFAENAAKLAEGFANRTIGLGGAIPVGSMVKNVVVKSKATTKANKSVQTGAGISLKDIGK